VCQSALPVTAIRYVAETQADMQ